MEIQRRYVVVCFGFLCLLISIGYRTIFAMTMVQVVEHNHRHFSMHDIFGSSCNKTVKAFSLNVSVSFSLYLNTAYFVGSLITQIPGGYLATRFPPSRVCGISIFISSLIMLVFPSIISKFQNRWLLVAIRFVQGLVEGSSVPALNGVVTAWAPKSEKSRIITIVYAGAYLSPAMASFLSGLIFCWFYWYVSLYLYGGCGVLWVVLWFIFIYDTPSDHPSLGDYETLVFHNENTNVQTGSEKIANKIPWCSILTCLPVYALLVGSFCRNWIFSMLATEIEQYFKDVYKSSIATIGLVTAAPQVVMTVMTVVGGFFIDRMIKHGRFSKTFWRKFAQCFGFGIEASCILALAFVHDEKISIILLCIGVGFSGLAISGYQVNVHDLAPQYTSILTGFMRFGTIGAVISTTLAGVLRENETKTTWRNLLLIAGSIHIGGVIFYGIFAKGKRMPWARKDETDERERLINPAVDIIGYDQMRYAGNERFGWAAVDLAQPSETDVNSDDDTQDWYLESI